LRSVELNRGEHLVGIITRLVLSGTLNLDNVLDNFGMSSLDHPNRDDAIGAFGRMKANDTSNVDNSNRYNAKEAFEDMGQIDEDGSSIGTNTGSFQNAASVLVENIAEDIRRLAIATNEEESQDQEDNDFRAHEQGQVPNAENHQAQPQ
jgi:hypothetical protein